ncbi:MAG: TonB-dependent receptor [Alphaproteobacteria bacterium]|nr:TonB-dependent receptor [Alphaproteobacteria bacterium]
MKTATTVSSLALAASMALAAPCLAQTSASGDEPIIVTATALNDAQDEALQGVTMLDRNALIDQLGAGLGETLDSQPGVASTSFGRGASRPIIRGLGEDRIRLLSNGTAQIDASSISPDHAVASEGLEAQTIEVLRGSAALAYGGNAVGGVVNVLDGRILEAAPGSAFSGEALASNALGFDETQAAGALAFANDRFAVRVDGFIRDAGDFEIPGFAYSAAKREEEIEEALAEGETPEDFAEGAAENSFSEAEGLGVGVSRYGGWGFAGISVRRLESSYGIPKAHAHGGDEEEEEEIFPGPFIDLEQTRYEARLGLTQGFGVIDAVQAEAALVDYAHSEIEESGEIGTRFSNEGFDARIEAFHTLGALQGVAGISGSAVAFSALGEEAFVTPTDIRDLGMFVVERLETGAWSFDGGLRYEQRAYDNEVYGERSFDLWSASLGVGYRPSEAITLGLSLSRTERAPTEIELFADGAHLATSTFEEGDPGLGTETALSIEGTARWTSDRLQLQANVFHIAFEDYTAFFDTGLEDVDSELPIFSARQEDATFTGGEVSASARLFARGDWAFRADATADIVRAELDAGGNAPRIPPRSFTLGFTGETGRFSSRVEWVSVAEAEDLADFETVTEGYDLFNAHISFRPVAESDRLVVRLDGRNLTDEEARVHSSFVKDLLPRPGRSMRLALSSRF